MLYFNKFIFYTENVNDRKILHIKICNFYFIKTKK